MFTLTGGKKEEQEPSKLTQYSKGAGCGCKVAPAVLEEILRTDPALSTFTDHKLLVGNQTKDDAAAYDIGNGMALISTVDFFTPIVDDARDYGRIAAANALSDVYAMGGKPILAIAVMGLPVEKLPAEIARQIIAGAKEICAQAGVSLAGGHTIDSPETFFGLAVNGMAPIANIKQNNTAQTGDILYLTKPIGTGILTTALKRGLITATELQPAVDSMSTLNTFGEVLGSCSYVHALTDVTGFGLLGHLIEMCVGSHVSAQLDYASIPLLPGVAALATKFIYADNTMRNWKSYEPKVKGISGDRLLTLCDPQTSGGLLISVAPSEATDLEGLASAHQLSICRVGHITTSDSTLVTVI